MPWVGVSFGNKVPIGVGSTFVPPPRVVFYGLCPSCLRVVGDVVLIGVLPSLLGLYGNWYSFGLPFVRFFFFVCLVVFVVLVFGPLLTPRCGGPLFVRLFFCGWRLCVRG